LKEIQHYAVWQQQDDQHNKYPLFLSLGEYQRNKTRHQQLNFLHTRLSDWSDAFIQTLKNDPTLVLLLDTENQHAMPEQRKFFFNLLEAHVQNPVIVLRKYTEANDEQLPLYAATDVGGLLIDGFGDGIMLSTALPGDRAEQLVLIKRNNGISFGILQAARTRMSKTEYISCPSCGRTLFDLQETTAMIRQRTDHLKGVKIGIMGCIVNGPGEMADADYGYVGSGKGKITLYRGQEVVKRNVPSEQAVDELIELIREDENWIEPEVLPAQ
ncbi:MAG: flavodoxin-dependent (E)-4-hydroxy-3-methylbut-2-enyl-diphosphate synthase, partial [Tunicatimonas sp.]|uniref:flavodoxin-dependent (E)-4-hydroxy-3-methylbut-2-enyl-diphosphate synthase n=1 Tax=Tunicatimonas sp. TaxID=1940096 RepID=UPI003C742C11